MRARAHALLQRALTSTNERVEAALEARLIATPVLSRCATVAFASSKGGVGKTTCAFVTGTLLADRCRLRVLVIDADPDPGTLALLLADRLRSPRCAADLLQALDTVESAARLRGFVSVDRSGLHVLAGPVEESAFGAVLHLCERFYDVVLVDLGTGLANPLAQRALQRSHHRVVISTPDWATATSVARSVAGWREQETVERTPPTIVLNRVTVDAEQLSVARRALDEIAAPGIVTLPHDPRLALMLDTGTFGFGALARPTRMGARELAVTILRHIG